MFNKAAGSLLILAILLASIITAYISIMEMRFSPGDIYPHYSTKRSDPLGARAFYESLDKLSGFRVSRNVTSLQRIKGLDDETTLFFLGLSRSSLTRLRATKNSPVLEAVRNGARLVIVMNPEFVPANLGDDENEANWFEIREELKKKSKAKNGEEDDKEEIVKDDSDEREDEVDDEKGEPFLEHVNIELMVPKEIERFDDGWIVEGAISGNAEQSVDLEQGIPKVFPNWRSQFRFKSQDKLWHTIAVSNDDPVVVERSYGKGKIVMTSDAYFSSNEALWKGEDSSFLWWLIGDKKKVVFDETIHGSVENGGIMKLIRRYRLHGFFAGVFIFIILLIWSSGSSLVPGSEEIERGLTAPDGAVAGEDAKSGMVRMLRRSVRKDELLDKCVEIWGKGDSRGEKMIDTLSADQKNDLERLLLIRKGKPKDLSISEGYEKLVQVLNQKQ